MNLPVWPPASHPLSFWGVRMKPAWLEAARAARERLAAQPIAVTGFEDLLAA